MYIDGNSQIVVYLNRKTPEKIISHEGTRMVKDGED